jgi:hypothetical protein
MKFLHILIFLSFCTSCSLFKTFDVSQDLSGSTQKICLSGEGKGRLGVNNNKYVFQYESGLNLEEANWKLALNFPLQKSELFELDWSKNGKVEFSSSIDERLLKENGKVNPRSLEFFTSSIGKLIQEIIELNKQKSNGKVHSKIFFRWQKTKKELSVINKKKNFKAVFTNMIGQQYFGLIKMSYIDKKKQKFRMDLVVKNCFQQEKP